MPEWRVPLADVEVSEEEIAAVAETYRSGWLSMGPRTAELEERFADYVNATHAVAVTNGTAALHLICAAAGIGPGDEVIVPSLTFVATAGAIRQTGATPVFADIVGVERPWLAAEAAEANADADADAAAGAAAGAVLAWPTSTVPITSPTCTVAPTPAVCTASTPATGDGSCTVILSVSSSATGSSTATASPTRLSQTETTASVIDSPSGGTTRSVMRASYSVEPM